MAKEKKHVWGTYSIFTRSDGRVVGQLFLGYDPETGKQMKKNYGGRDPLTGKPRTARQIEAEIQTDRTDMEKGLPVKLEKQSVATYLEKWLADVSLDVRPKTYYGYAQAVRLYINPVLGRVTLTPLTERQIQDWINELSQQKHKRTGATLQARTWLGAFAVLNMALKRAVDFKAI